TVLPVARPVPPAEGAEERPTCAAAPCGGALCCAGMPCGRGMGCGGVPGGGVPGCGGIPGAGVPGRLMPCGGMACGGLPCGGMDCGGTARGGRFCREGVSCGIRPPCWDGRGAFGDPVHPWAGA